jgi:hypothetical protein
MAKPKGATLTRLFAVSDAERKAFWADLEVKKTSLESGTPESGAPISGRADPGVPDMGAPVKESVQPAPSHSDSASSHTGMFGSGVPVSGVPVLPRSLDSDATEIDTSSQIPPRRKIRETVRVQDGHSLGEQAVYSALWAAAQPHMDECRRITIGYRTLSDACGLTVNNCKANLQSLIRKLAIEEAASHTHSQGTTYLIYSYPVILRRRREAGMTHVIKTKGVIFVDHETGIPVPGVPGNSTRIPTAGTPEIQTGTPVPNVSGVPVSGTPIRNKEVTEEMRREKRSSSAFPLVVQAAREHGTTLDDDAVRRIVLRCQAFDEAATEEEVAHFLSVKLTQLRSSRSVGNLVGLLIKAVPEYFAPPATELQDFREQGHDRGESAQNTSRSREMARSILEDPAASENDREWARVALGEVADF